MGKSDKQMLQFLQYFSALIFNWCFLAKELHYERVEGVKSLLIELSVFFRELRMNDGLQVSELCAFIRAFSFMMNHLQINL